MRSASREALGLLETIALTSCVVLACVTVTDRLENVRLLPPSVGQDSPAVVSEGEVQQALAVVDEVARLFEFRRITYTPEARRIDENVTRKMGFTVLADYARDRAPKRGSFVLMSVARAIDGSDLVVSARAMRGGSADEFLIDVREAVATRLREAFPEWTIEVESGTVDATLAP